MLKAARTLIGGLTMLVVLGLVILDPFTTETLLSPERLYVLLTFVAAMLGVELVRSWVPDTWSIKLEMEDD